MPNSRTTVRLISVVFPCFPCYFSVLFFCVWLTGLIAQFVWVGESYEAIIHNHITSSCHCFFFINGFLNPNSFCHTYNCNADFFLQCTFKLMYQFNKKIQEKNLMMCKKIFDRKVYAQTIIWIIHVWCLMNYFHSHHIIVNLVGKER